MQLSCEARPKRDASVTAEDGSKLTSALDLNTVIGNVNGTFSWGGTNFSQGAQNIQITDGFTLEGDLPDGNGNMAHSVMYIGSCIAKDSNGNPAIQHAAGLQYSTAHAGANTNDEADQAMQSQAGTASGSSNTIHSITTVTGDASTYWPDGNAPASGPGFSRLVRRIIPHFVVVAVESVGKMVNRALVEGGGG